MQFGAVSPEASLRAGELPFGLVVQVCASPSRQDSVFSHNRPLRGFATHREANTPSEARAEPCLGIYLWLRATTLLRLQTLSPHSRHSPSLRSIHSRFRTGCGIASCRPCASFLLSLCFLCLPCRNWRGLRMIRPIGSARRLRRGKWEEGRGRTRARLPVRQGWRRLVSPRWFCAEAKDARVVHLGHALPAGPANCGSGVTGLTTGGRMGV